MCTFKKTDTVTIVVDSYIDAICAKKFLEYILSVELVDKFVTPAEISSIRKSIKLLQSYISEKETAHVAGYEVKPAKIDVVMYAETYYSFIEEFMQK